METVMTPTTCDRSGCPAPPCHQLTLHGQDFYFCGHHAAELMLVTSDAVSAPLPAMAGAV